MNRIATIRDRITNTPGLLRDVIAVLACIAIGLSCSAYILVHQHVSLPWDSEFRFSADFDKAPGVRPQALEEVRIAGVSVGRIRSASVTNSGDARLGLEIDPTQVVYQNAQLLLRTKSPLNVMYVELNPGTPDAPRLQSGGVIPITQTQRAAQPYELLDKLDDRTQAALTSLLDQAQVGLRGAGSTLPTSLDATRQTMVTFKPVIDALVQRRQHLADLVHAFSTIATAVGHDGTRMSGLTASMDQTLSALASRDVQLQATLRALPGFTSDLNTSMNQVSDLTGALNPTLDDLAAAAPKLPGAITSLTGSVAAIRNFVHDGAPVINRAGPIVSDLRLFTGNAGPAFADLRPVAGYLPLASAMIAPWMGDLAAFTYQTSSAFSLYDANGGLGRANLDLDLTNLSGGLGNVGVKGSK
jgi:phospholipid/cholesterol/gamma-HCH transport system substrate-binding protein